MYRRDCGQRREGMRDRREGMLQSEGYSEKGMLQGEGYREKGMRNCEGYRRTSILIV